MVLLYGHYFYDTSAMRLKLRLVLSLVFCVSNASLASGNEFQNRLDSLYIDKQFDTLYERLLFPQSKGETRVSLMWLREHFKTGDGGARLAYIYAARLNGSGIAETALFAYTVAMLTARMDAARCEDIDAPIAKIVKWEEGLQHLERAFRGLPRARQERFLKLAAKFERKTRNRGVDEWMCSGGKSQYEEYYRKYGTLVKAPIKITSVPFSGNKIILLDDTSVKPRLIDERYWRSMNAKIVEKVRAELMTGDDKG